MKQKNIPQKMQGELRSKRRCPGVQGESQSEKESPGVNKNVSKKFGFTLIELLVVTTIIILLTTIGIVSYRRAGETARDGKRKADLETVKQALVLYRADNGQYLDGSYSSMVLILKDADYLSSPTPFDPQGTEDIPKYIYSPTCTTSCTDFTLSVTLEDEDATNPYTITNP